jgi:hypothetical protein
MPHFASAAVRVRKISGLRNACDVNRPVTRRIFFPRRRGNLSIVVGQGRDTMLVVAAGALTTA